MGWESNRARPPQINCRFAKNETLFLKPENDPWVKLHTKEQPLAVFPRTLFQDSEGLWFAGIGDTGGYVQIVYLEGVLIDIDGNWSAKTR
jgi:hypothetical protein